MTRQPPPLTTAAVLLARYDALWFDAWGVLMDDRGALPGAIALIDRLNATGRPYCVLTNSASRLPEATAALLGGRGLAIAPERVVSSGMLLEGHFRAHGLVGSRCVVFGPEDAQAFARRAGGEVVPIGAGCDAEVVVIADEKGYPLLEHIDHVLGLLLRRLDRGDPVRLVVCNPDLIYPKGPGDFGLTAGGLAAFFEAVLKERYPGRPVAVARLGKPYAPIFEEAARRTGTRNAVMIGDQLATDILGAQRFGVASALVASGLACTVDDDAPARPTWRLDDLDPDRLPSG
jgi:HAD superfamily hydrolase (TIGR01450 family)